MATLRQEITCKDAQELLRPYLEGEMSDAAAALLEGHLNACARCREQLDARREICTLLQGAYQGHRISGGFDQTATKKLEELRRTGQLATPVAVPQPGDDAFLAESEEEEFSSRRSEGLLAALQLRMGAAPWWIVSGAFHALLILLVFLVGMVVMQAKSQDVVIVTDLAKQPPKPPEEKKVERDVFKQVAVTEVAEITEQTMVTHEIVEFADTNETDNDADAHDAAGNQDAISDIDLGGTGTVGSLGVGGGGASGAFGRPGNAGGRLKRAIAKGGGKETESAVDAGLEWLARHQEADGRWSHQKHGATNQYHVGMRGDVGMTGFALLAFLGAGHTEKVGKYKENVRRAVAWLLQHQGQKDQGTGEKTPHEGRWVDLNYSHGIATMALSEAAAMSRLNGTRTAAQKAVDGVEYAQNRDNNESDRWAWDYFPKGGVNDASIMAWNVLALKSGKVAGLKVDPAAFEGAIRWIDHAQILGEHKGKEHIEDYEWLGGLMPYRGKPGAVQGVGGWATMAAAALCRVMFGGAALDHPGVLGPCNKILKGNLPKGYPYNLYYGYYASLLMFQKGGEHWKAWNEAMKPALVNGQRKGGPKDGSAADVDGSWDHGEESHCESRVMSTCLAILSLEVYYRYLPVYRE
ncbi:MAG: zf-HC2 domain-containing protein [Planctomycetes bacterium]|nr:zf-HC2 domain-containing protein [Planctomycetota bacterium]